MSDRPPREEGLVVVITALAVTGVCMALALVLDIGRMRAAIRLDKGTTDLAATAGVGRLQFGPWSGVCEARTYLLGNGRGFSSFDAGSETWSNAATPPTVYSANPCSGTLNGPDAVPCAANQPSTWRKLQATARSGTFTIEIQSGYALPDARFTEDTNAADSGDASQGSCDNLAVILTRRVGPSFAQVAGFGTRTLRVRSVGRLNSQETLDFVAALQLLELHNCNVLQTGGANTRVIAQPYGTYPGTVQIDSADDSGSCPQPILNAQATATGPSVLACSANSLNLDCHGGTGTRASRIGIYALNFNRPAGEITTSFPGTYGDTAARASPRTGRKFADRKYRANIAALDAKAKAVITGNAGKPPGCASVAGNACTGNGVTWLVLQQSNCNSLATFFLVAGRTSAPNIWFNCDLNVNTPLVLSASNSVIVVTGQLAVGSVFTVSDPRQFFIGGRSNGNKIGFDVGGAGTVLNINTGAGVSCATRTGAGHANQMVVGSGTFKVASGGTIHMCQTAVELASGYDKVPASDGTAPCSSPCSTYTGTLDIASGSFLDWSAPNEITGRNPTAAELANTNLFEDLALWTEAGGNTNGLSGGSATSMTGVYFIPNADSFNLAGNGSLPITLSAQFIATTLKATGGATFNLVPNPEDSIATSIYRAVLVR